MEAEESDRSKKIEVPGLPSDADPSKAGGSFSAECKSEFLLLHLTAHINNRTAAVSRE